MINLYELKIASHAAGPCERCLKYGSDYLVAHEMTYNDKVDVLVKTPHIFCPSCVDKLREEYVLKQKEKEKEKERDKKSFDNLNTKDKNRVIGAADFLLNRNKKEE